MSTPEIAELKAQIKKMQAFMAMTGKQVVELQMENTRQRVGDVDRRNKELQAQIGGAPARGAPAPQDNDFATNNDIVELVQELQDQLDILDERSIRRTINSRVTASTPIVSLPTIANEYPDAFPHTLKDFEQLTTPEIERLAQFYELLPPDESEMAEMLQKVSMTAQQAGVAAPAKKEMTDDDAIEYYNKLAHFLGLATSR